MRDLYLIATKLFGRMSFLESCSVVATCVGIEVPFFNLLDVTQNRV